MDLSAQTIEEFDSDATGDDKFEEEKQEEDEHPNFVSNMKK